MNIPVDSVVHSINEQLTKIEQNQEVKDERVNFCYVNIWLEELLKDNILVIVSLVTMAFSDDYRGSWRTLGWREGQEVLGTQPMEWG